MNFFENGSPYLTHPLLTVERSVADIAQVAELVGGLSEHSSVVDLGCGFGRHALVLASQGHSVIGFDPSVTMISTAQQAIADQQTETPGSAEFHVGAAADAATALKAGSVDLALCLFTTFGQRSTDLASDASTTTLLETAVTLLKPGGSLVLELPDRDRAVALLVAEEQLGPTFVTRRYDQTNQVLHERFETPDGDFDLAYELFSPDELREMIADVGLEEAAFADQALVPPPLTFMTFVARRPGRTR